MKRLIIDFDDCYSAKDALRMVTEVVADGRVSKGPQGDQYCWSTMIMNPEAEWAVVSSIRRKPSKKYKTSDRFAIRKPASERVQGRKSD